MLVQLPPKLALDPELAKRFFETLRNTIDAEIVCEPRNVDWFEEDADALFGSCGLCALRRIRL